MCLPLQLGEQIPRSCCFQNRPARQMKRDEVVADQSFKIVVGSIQDHVFSKASKGSIPYHSVSWCSRRLLARENFATEGLFAHESCTASPWH